MNVTLGSNSDPKILVLVFYNHKALSVVVYINDPFGCFME